MSSTIGQITDSVMPYAYAGRQSL